MTDKQRAALEALVARLAAAAPSRDADRIALWLSAARNGLTGASPLNEADVWRLLGRGHALAGDDLPDALAATGTYEGTPTGRVYDPTPARQELPRPAFLLNRSETDLVRQWFNAVQDLNPAYLTASDYVLAIRIYESLEWPVPRSVSKGAKIPTNGS